MKPRKAIIPVAGFGTRFLPITKSVPKEMLPILDKPVIQYVVEEAVEAGIEDIIFVTSPQKHAIEEYFNPNPELEAHLKAAGKEEKLKQIREVSSAAKFVFINQKGPYGNGTPVLNAKDLVGNEPFAVMWGDDVFSNDSGPRALGQMVKVFDKYQDPVLCAIKITDEETKKYGVIEGKEIEKGVVKIDKIVEKPGPEKSKSRLGSVARYILTPDIFAILEKTPLGKSNELWLVDAIFSLSKKRPLYSCQIEGKYHDIGSKKSWLATNSEFAKKDKDLA